MAHEITKHAGVGTSVDLHGKANVTAGRSTSLDDLQFTRKALIYEKDMPTVFRQGVKASTEVALRAGRDARSGGEIILASSVTKISAPDEHAARKASEAAIASGMRQLDKPRKSGNRIVQRRIGWIATPVSILITTAERELVRTADNKLSPSDNTWLIEDRRTYKSQNGPAKKRSGVVPIPEASSALGPGTVSAGLQSQEDLENQNAASFPEGAAALGLLPPQVRSSAIARIPAPTQFDGIILQTLDPITGAIEGFEVNVLRMDRNRAVVLQAKRKLDESKWHVSQAYYHLNEPEIEQA